MDYNPSNALMRNGWEATEQVPVEANLTHYHDFVSENLVDTSETIQQRSITRNSQRPVAAESKITIGGTFDVDWNAEGHVHYIANAQRKASVTNPTAGVYIHKMAPSETSVTIPSYMGVEIFRDDEIGAQLFKGSRVNSLQFGFGIRQFLQGQIGILSPMADFWKAAAQSAGTSTDPILRGLLNNTAWNLADHDVYVKATDVTALPTTFKVKFKVSAAASYGSIEVVVSAADRWIHALDSTTGLPLGTIGLPVDFYYANFTGIALNDEWKIEPARAEWTPVFPDVIPFNEVYSFIYVDGEEIPVTTAQVNLTRPLVAPFKVGGRYAWTVRERGLREVSGTIAREYLTDTLVKKLRNGTSFTFEGVGNTGVYIGSTSYQHSIRAVCGKCLLSGPGPTVTSPTEMNENLTFTAHPDPTNGDGNVDDLTVYVTNSIADLTV